MRRCGWYRQCLRVCAALTLMAPIIGCGAPERPKTIPLDGHVTIDGKAPGEDGKIYFTPTAAADGYSKRPASGSYNPEGHYRVMSWTPDDGLVPGHYTVSVVPNEPDKTAIPAKYQQSASSGLELDVPVDKGKIEFDINVVTK